MEWGLTYKVTGMVITCGYYSGRPYRWNSITNEVVDIQTTWEFLRWILGVVINTIIKIAIIIGVVQDVMEGRIIMTNQVHTARVILSIIYVWSTVLDFHTIHRRKELRIFMNTQLSYFETFIQNYSRTDIEPKRNWTPIFLGVLVGSLLLLPFWCMVGYFLRCELHPLAALIQTCSNGQRSLIFGDFQKSYWFILIMALISFLFFLHNLSTTFAYLVIAAPWGFMAIDNFKELVAQPPEDSATSAIFKTFKEMFHNYRCFQLLIIIANKFFLDFIAPFILIITMILNIGVLYTLIRVPMQPVQYIVSIVFELVLVSVYALIYGRLAILQEVSTSIHDSWKELCVTKYRSVRFNSMAHVRIRIGPFYYLERQTVIAICEIILGHTLDLLLLNPT